MKKRILLQTFLIIAFLLSMEITYAPSSKAPEIQNKSQLASDQSRPLSIIERRKKEKEEYLRKKVRALGFQFDSYNIQLVGMWPYGPCFASALDTTRNIAVIGNGETLQVLNISTPTSPSRIGELFLQAIPWAIAISGNYAYVLTEDSLRVIDISILVSPKEVGNADIFYLGSFYGYALAVSSNYAYVAAYDCLRIFDISTPTNPIEVGTYAEYENDVWVYEVAIRGNHAFIINDYWTGTEYINELRIIDITNPYAPTLIGTYQAEKDYWFWSINASATGYAYFIQYDSNTDTSEITIIDVATDPANPTEVGNYVESERWFEDLEVSGNYVYYISYHLDDGSETFEIINISNLSSPFYVGECDAAGYSLDFSGSYVGIYGYGGFYLYDVSSPSSPFQLGSYYTPDWAGDYGNSIAVSGDYAYIANYSDGLRIMGISPPYNPSVAGICDTVLGRAGVVVSWNYAYGVDNSGFWIVDISSPSSPDQEGYLDMSWYTRDVAVSGSYAYVCGYQYVSDEARASLAIIDVSDPANPSLIGSFVCPTESYNYGGIALSGNYAYLGLRDYSTGSLKAGLKIIDISNPANPTEVGSYVSDDYGYVSDVEVRGNYAYLAGRNFIIIDVSNRWSPIEISSYRPSTISRSYGLALSGNYAYLTEDGLMIIDISDPYNPTEAGYYNIDLGDAVAVSGNYAYIPGSLHILKNTLAPEVSITSPSAWSILTGSVSIQAEASHSSGIAKVEFYMDDVLRSTDSTSPYSYTWDTTSVTEGLHKIRARANNNNGKSSDFEIEVNVLQGLPFISLSTSMLNFGAITGGYKTSDQEFRISNTGGGILDWSISDNANWLSCTPTSGTGNAVITASVDPSGLAAGTYPATITVSSSNASNSPQTINVALTVMSSAASTQPFGSFDTPADGTTGITGSIPVTGWVLDDVEATKVEIWRDPVGGEPTSPNGLVYIGDSVFVEGARPDVEQLYSDYPLCSRAGWGYMLLTNFLPNQGNGTYGIHALAYDKEGNNDVTLGTKTITCDNANAIKPFGTIDTPGQGGEASGSAYVNFGWALTPQPNYIPEDGSTITVWINGTPVGHPVYNQYRADIATLFPGYANSNGAVGYFYVNTTAYDDGVHTIAWSVEDSGGNSEGIGSRYFSIFNTGGMSATQTGSRSQKVNLDTPLSFEFVNNLPPSVEPIRVRRGYTRGVDLDRVEAEPDRVKANQERVDVDNYGGINIAIREVERVELDLGEGTDYRGYLVVGDKLRPLPIGSTLNAEKGIFSWQPGLGFIGAYDFVFVKEGKSGGGLRKIKVRIRILPKFSLY